jgi:hypothetical protein
VKRFIDFFALWVAINMIAWSTLWWTYDKTVTWQEEGHLLQQTSIGALAITLAIWGVTRAGRPGSSVPRKYSKAVEDALDRTVKVEDEHLAEVKPLPWEPHEIQDDFTNA